MKYGINKLYEAINDSSPSQRLVRIFNLREAKVRILPEVEEFLTMIDGFALQHFC